MLLNTALSRPANSPKTSTPGIRFGWKSSSAEYTQIRTFLDSQGLDGDKLDPKLTFVQDWRSMDPAKHTNPLKKLRAEITKYLIGKERTDAYSAVTEQKKYTDPHPWTGIVATLPDEDDANEYLKGEEEAHQEYQKMMKQKKIPNNFELFHLKVSATRVLSLYCRRGTVPANFVPPTLPVQ